LAGPDVATVGLIELLADAEYVQGLPSYPRGRASSLEGRAGLRAHRSRGRKLFRRRATVSTEPSNASSLLAA